MTTENLITVLDLARMELESAYKRLGYSNSNVLTSINESIVHLQREALSQADVIGSGHECQEDIEPDEKGNVRCKICKEIIGHAGG